MKESVFNAKDHYDYLAKRFSPHGDSRGMRSELAKLLRVRPSYVTMILSGELQLNLDHVPAINNLLQHTDQESEFLMLLVLHTQAGNKEMKDYCKNKMNKILESRRIAADWIENQKTITEEQQAKFVSEWYYCIIHAMTNIPAMQTKSALAERIGLSLKTISNALDFLVQIGVVEEKSGRYKMTEKRLHLKKNSTWISHYHNNIRQLATRSFSEPLPEDLHYSFVMSISNADKEKIRKKLIQAMEEIEPIIADSKDEDVSILSLDFFKI